MNFVSMWLKRRRRRVALSVTIMVLEYSIEILQHHRLNNAANSMWPGLYEAAYILTKHLDAAKQLKETL